MKPYQPWDFCKPDNCTYAKIDNLEERAAQCLELKCRVYRFHQYLSNNGQILEAGSELAKVVAEAERLRVENEALKTMGTFIALQSALAHPKCAVFSSEEWAELMIAHDLLFYYLAEQGEQL